MCGPQAGMEKGLVAYKSHVYPYSPHPHIFPALTSHKGSDMLRGGRGWTRKRGWGLRDHIPCVYPVRAELTTSASSHLYG